MKSESKPPLHTALTDLAAWTLMRTADLPKSHRFTVGQRLDNLTLDALLMVTEALYSPPARKRPLLVALNLHLELLRVLWRLVHDQRWISQQQLVFVMGRVDEIGRMTGGWLRQLESGAMGSHLTI
ncbi:MAG: four helix bundle protein [Verrucomicrobiales bacterium]|nr:four helix bundle protein [Verrucomicrobiales bacterium]